MEAHIRVSKQRGRLGVSRRSDFSSPEGDSLHWRLSPKCSPSLRMLQRPRVFAAGSDRVVTVDPLPMKLKLYVCVCLRLCRGGFTFV